MAKGLSKFGQDLKRALQQQAKAAPRDAALRAHYMNTQLEVLGLTIPEVRAVTREHIKTANLSTIDDFSAWDTTWLESENFEVKAAALIALESKEMMPVLMEKWGAFSSWVSSIENWAHSDGYSGLVAKLLEASPKTIMPTLKTWNTSEYSWERRQSLVSLFYYARHRKSYPPYAVVEKFISRLIADDDIYVQKAVGWTLRESSQVYIKETRQFLLNNVTSISSTAFSSSTEKIETDLKNKLLGLRVAARKNR
jgi:3-methyladenine DNA glycosylase AlkD